MKPFLAAIFAICVVAISSCSNSMNQDKNNNLNDTTVSSQNDNYNDVSQDKVKDTMVLDTMNMPDSIHHQ